MNSTGLTTVANVAIATGPAVFCVKCMVYYMQGWISEFRFPEANSYKGDLYFTNTIQKLHSMKESYVFHFVWEFASA